jgi:hypothetical protein
MRETRPKGDRPRGATVPNEISDVDLLRGGHSCGALPAWKTPENFSAGLTCLDFAALTRSLLSEDAAIIVHSAAQSTVFKQ